MYLTCIYFRFILGHYIYMTYNINSLNNSNDVNSLQILIISIGSPRIENFQKKLPFVATFYFSHLDDMEIESWCLVESCFATRWWIANDTKNPSIYIYNRKKWLKQIILASVIKALDYNYPSDYPQVFTISTWMHSPSQSMVCKERKYTTNHLIRNCLSFSILLCRMFFSHG